MTTPELVKSWQRRQVHTYKPDFSWLWMLICVLVVGLIEGWVRG